MFVVLLFVLVGYFLGSLPAGYFLLKWLRGVDIREMGTHSTGFTNVFRNYGLWYGLVVLLVDMGKAWLLIASLGWNIHSVWLQVIVLGALMAGSKFPVFLRFRGGKGVALFLGGASALFPFFTVAMLSGLWLVLFFLLFRRVMSLTNLVFAIIFMLYLFIVPEPVALKSLGVGVALFLMFSHRENIKRILQGKERPLSYSPGKL